jgi:hypothetical protein
MERKGKSPCRSPVCSVFTWGHGHARRRSWTSSLGCSASTYSRASWTRKKRRCRPTTTTCTTLGRPRARIRTKVLLRHILGTPLHGQAGIHLHLGQKPKLGGGTPMIHSSIYHNLSILCISMFRFLLFYLLLLFLFLLSKTQKDQKYFRCFSLFASLIF